MSLEKALKAERQQILLRVNKTSCGRFSLTSSLRSAEALSQLGYTHVQHRYQVCLAVGT